MVLPEYFVRVQINLPDLPTLPSVLLFSDKLSKRVRSAAAASSKQKRSSILHVGTVDMCDMYT